MTAMAAAAQFGTWTAPGHSLRIEYSCTVLDEIREITVDGYHRVPHGGVETGGILYGTQQDGLVSIQAWRPIDCEYAKGPSFSLSEKDEAALAQALQSWRDDPELAALEPAGWYRAHTRSEILLSDADLEFYNRFFPEPWQVALIVRPASFTPTRAGFFFRESDGSVHSQASYLEFVLSPMPIGQLTEAPAVIVPEPAPAETESSPVREPVFLPETPARTGRRKWFTVAGLGLLAIAALGYWQFPRDQGLSLSATDMGGQLRIAWDRTTRPIRDATAGSLEIEDRGVHSHVELAPADLRSGSVSYARQSGDVVVRLKLAMPGRPPVEEMTHFLKPGESVTSAPAPPVEAVIDPQALSQPEPKAETKPVQIKPPPAAPRTASTTVNVKRVIPFRAPSATVRAPSSPLPEIAPPKLTASSKIDGPPAQFASAPLPPAPLAPPRPKAAAAPPTSGRIIWTGRLPKKGRLVLEGNRASAGAVVGSLPARRARVIVYPGDLTPTGIRLFSADPRYYQPKTEAASAANGWNPTTYVYDPKRAASVIVVEQPGPQNGYTLVLECNAAKLGMVALEWHAVP